MHSSFDIPKLNLLAALAFYEQENGNGETESFAFFENWEAQIKVPRFFSKLQNQ